MAMSAGSSSWKPDVPESCDSEATRELLARLQQGDRQALEPLLAEHREYLRGLIELRLDGRLRVRVDASDVVQEAQMEVARRIDDYLMRRPMPFRLWLRQTVYQNLLRLRRQHVEADCRTVERKLPLPDGSSALLELVAGFIGSDEFFQRATM
jgi:RNA polymerase sigma-70 factor (ECF subfamily)